MNIASHKGNQTLMVINWRMGGQRIQIPTLKLFKKIFVLIFLFKNMWCHFKIKCMYSFCPKSKSNKKKKKEVITFRGNDSIMLC